MRMCLCLAPMLFLAIACTEGPRSQSANTPTPQTAAPTSPASESPRAAQSSPGFAIAPELTVVQVQTAEGTFVDLYLSHPGKRNGVDWPMRGRAPRDPWSGLPDWGIPGPNYDQWDFQQRYRYLDPADH